MHPLATIWERIFITLAFHHAYHGKNQVDGIGEPNGYFGIMFSIWGQFFGTAFYSRKFPKEYGLPIDPKENWTAAYLNPIITSSDKKSELPRGFKKANTRIAKQSSVALEKEKSNLHYQCQKSNNPPFCAGERENCCL